MASNKPSTEQATEAVPAESTAAAPVTFPLSLQEFCVRLSQTDRRVELIGGFEHSERVAGRHRDTEANYAKRYDEFVTQPV